MSPRAAARLESLGFGEVYEYKAGMSDWMPAGVPTEGTNAQRSRARDVARKDVPTAGLKERLGDVSDRVRAANWEAVVVVNDSESFLACCGRRSWAKTLTSSWSKPCVQGQARSVPTC